MTNRCDSTPITPITYYCYISQILLNELDDIFTKTMQLCRMFWRNVNISKMRFIFGTDAFLMEYQTCFRMENELPLQTENTEVKEDIVMSLSLILLLICSRRFSFWWARGESRRKNKPEGRNMDS